MSVREKAVDTFVSGYSCSQAVFSALAGRWNIGPEVSLRVSAGFGGGIARSARTCGCVTGAMMAIGMDQASVTAEENKAARERTYALCQQLLRAFGERHGSTICGDLMGCDIGTPEGMAEAIQKGLFRSRCPNFVGDAVEIAESLLP